MTQTDFDVVICGGGLAGLSLALQLRQEQPVNGVDPILRVGVVERTARPLPPACHKVGESTVEMGAYYFDRMLGLGESLRERHLPKNGLRFFCGPGTEPLARRSEIGPVEFPIVPSYQIDRGRFETELRERCEDAGVTLLEGWTVDTIDLSDCDDTPHRVHLRHLCATGQSSATAPPDSSSSATWHTRWVVDASGRRRLLHKQLDLRRPSAQTASAAWFRVAERVRVDELVPQDEKPWHSRDIDGTRWLSTVHLMGPGYWVWLIPLADDFTSIGIVADAAHHDFREFNTEARARRWLATHEPALAERMDAVATEDFRVMHDFSYLTERAFSKHRWACVGEAALFADPLYSPGSDFLGLSNSIAARLILDDMRGALDEEIVNQLNDVLVRSGENFVEVVREAGVTFPHGSIFGAKTWWDFFHYWTFLAPYFIQGIYRLDAAEHRRFLELGSTYRALNSSAQRVLTAWATLKSSSPPRGSETPHAQPAGRPFIPLPMFPSILAERHVELAKPATPDEVYAKMVDDVELSHQFIQELVVHALSDLPPEHAAQFGQQSGLAAGDVRIDRDRFVVESQSRRTRLASTPRIGRDLERAVGRTRSGELPLLDRLDRALDTSQRATPTIEQPQSSGTLTHL